MSAPTNGSFDSTRIVGAFVTNKWLVSTLLLLIMAMGGYIVRGNDRSGEAQASTVAGIERRLSLLEIDTAAARATQTAQYVEMIRRLDRIENAIYGTGSTSRPPR